MSSPLQSPRKVKLGDYELNLDTAELRNNGSKTTIPPNRFKFSSRFCIVLVLSLRARN